MIWRQNKDCHASVGAMNMIHARRSGQKNTPPDEIRAKASVNLLIYDFSILKTIFLRRKKGLKLPFFWMRFWTFSGKTANK
jgi:hypothetical protein